MLVLSELNLRPEQKKREQNEGSADPALSNLKVSPAEEPTGPRGVCVNKT